MNGLRWIILALALLQGAWFIFDGTRALRVGDYVTPTSSRRAGQLGPWSRVVSAAGLDPRGTFIKCLHLGLGIAWLVALVAFAFRPEPGWWGVLVCAVASLWYLPVGTLSGLIVIALLWTPQIRNLL